jgi:hemoglobin-like flavoprotein
MEIVDITTEFYHRMFRNVPAVCPMFNEESQRNKVQHRALAQSALAYVGHLANKDDVEPMLQRIAERHCAVGVLPEQYSVVHDNFLAATAHVLGDAVTAPVAAAWSKVLMHFATALIEREKALYEATAWKGCRAFRIAEIVEHGTVAKSFTFAPVDNERRFGQVDGRPVRDNRVEAQCAASLHDFVQLAVPNHAQNPPPARAGARRTHDEHAGRQESGRHRDDARTVWHIHAGGCARSDNSDAAGVHCGRHRHHARGGNGIGGATSEHDASNCAVSLRVNQGASVGRAGAVDVHSVGREADD